jgi:SAM-dependent methyltransferase
MNWHSRYTQQASWTRDLRAYLFERTGLKSAGRFLEVGCGTGAVLSGIVSSASSHGLDIQFASLEDTRLNAPSAILVQGDALSLPYADECFDIVFCHFLLLWVADPLGAVLEMNRVASPGGNILALAEPDYSARLDRPEALSVLGKWQAQALQRQGADPSLGGKLADLFFRAGVEIVETGTIQRSGEAALTPAERELEWSVLEADLAGIVPDSELKKMKALDEGAWAAGERELYVPTYFAWGRKEV